MNAGSEILEKWIEKVAESHPQSAAALRTPKPDPFRNPIAYTIRKGLAQLWEQLQGEMNPDAIDSALDNMLRIRAVQDMSASQAASFVIPLRAILRQVPGTFDLDLLDNRIDQLAPAAWEKYMQCRDQVRAARLHEAARLASRRRLIRKAGA